MHAHMRSSLDTLLLALEKARMDTVECDRTGTASQAKRATAVQPSKQSLLERLRQKAHTAPVKDMRSMLNRYKENRVPFAS